jgi:hypothetical protein
MTRDNDRKLRSYKHKRMEEIPSFCALSFLIREAIAKD